MPKVAKAPEPQNKPVTLRSDRFKEVQFVSRGWHVILPDEVDFEECLKPAFWTLVARRMRLMDTIELVNNALTLYARLIVVESNPFGDYVQVREIEKKTLAAPGVPPADIEGFTITHSGAFDKWVIARKADGEVIKKGFETMQEARYCLQTEVIPQSSGRDP